MRLRDPIPLLGRLRLVLVSPFYFVCKRYRFGNPLDGPKLWELELLSNDFKHHSPNIRLFVSRTRLMIV